MSGPVLGVVEIVQDLSEAYHTIFRFQVLVVSTSALVMLVLMLVLIYVVKRGESIIERRAQERLRLKEQLSRAEHLSSIGEMVAAVSHEIRNPLGIIRNSSELLKKKISAVDPSNPIPDIIIEESTRLVWPMPTPIVAPFLQIKTAFDLTCLIILKPNSRSAICCDVGSTLVAVLKSSAVISAVSRL